ncbi:lipoprotein [Salinibacillus xinjiangensis]|uniref:Lipoprotein n=1 Tax=Salinibacillus xinjiangensis TaxID=1229268 RepID=A0A6G1X4X4_9BACI|nr:lipoprotein [Salinibacillus xinjiangensis]MRG86014.1 hypothetical protein [Salinibacillus xinjiangensis]
MKKIIILLAFITLMLSACSGNEETINFEDKSFANTLFIQKAENNSSSEEMRKMVTDKEKINEILSMVEGLKVEKINTDKFMEKLMSQSSYMFGFLKGDGTNTEKGKYAFNFLEDGTILFNYDKDDNPGTPLITTDKHKDLLNQMKMLLEIHF